MDFSEYVEGMAQEMRSKKQYAQISVLAKELKIPGSRTIAFMHGKEERLTLGYEPRLDCFIKWDLSADGVPVQINSVSISKNASCVYRKLLKGFAKEATGKMELVENA